MVILWILCGGYSTPPFTRRSTIDRIDYSNDTGTTSPKGPLVDDVDRSPGVSAERMDYSINSKKLEVYDEAFEKISSNTRNLSRKTSNGVQNVWLNKTHMNYGRNLLRLLFRWNWLSSTTQRSDFSNDTATSTVDLRYQLGDHRNTNSYDGGGNGNQEHRQK